MAIASKNQCAFPGCDHPLLNQEGIYIAELCHIEAAEPGGPRFNAEQSDEERRSSDNLLFLCHRHHKETDDENEYPVSRLKKIKRDHEQLPEVGFNHELLLRRVEQVAEEQAQILQAIQGHSGVARSLPNYAIKTSDLRPSWTPEQGRFYESGANDDSGFKFMMKDGWLHVEQKLQDGAVAYYEINEEGSVRQSHFPYPINEYRVVISPSVVMRKEPVEPSLGNRAVRTVLKWSLGDVVEHFVGDQLIGVDCNARCLVNHKERLISIVEPRTSQP